MMVLHFLTSDMKNYYTAETVLFFQLGLLDIFVAYMIWFLMDDDAKPAFIENHNTNQLF